MVPRGQVIWLGEPPPEDAYEGAQLRRLNLVCDANTGVAQIDAAFAQARALILHVRDTADPLIRRARERLVGIALRHGLRVFAVAPFEAIEGLPAALGDQPWLRPQVVTADNLSGVFDQILDSTPGPAWRQDIQFPDPVFRRLSDEDRLLLRRAFNDCTEVRLTDLNGRCKVFQALAKLRTSRAGPHPLPFFVKLDRHPKIDREMRNYRDCTALFIPFYARPNLDWDRCMLGEARGIIVGNFVEHSSSLAELVAQGAAQSAINSLFDDALRGWRRQAILLSSTIVTQPMAASLGGAMQHETWALAEVRANAAKKFGATMTPQALAELLDGKPAFKHRRALMHGDLHAENVRVRHGQAILIDFAAVAEGPLVADPAALETALCLTAQADSEASWQDCVSELYEFDNLLRLPPARLPGAELSHLCDAVRQVRRFGLADALSEHEYATAVAVFLFRHAFRRPLDNEPDTRRPFFYALAETVAKRL